MSRALASASRDPASTSRDPVSASRDRKGVGQDAPKQLSLPPASPRSAPRAFTLVEAAVAIALSTILVVVVGASLTNSLKAVDRGADANARARAAADALDQLSNDLSLAVVFNQRTATVLDFTVPDRYGQAYNPAVRYEWSGTPGDPLYRSFDGSAQSPVLLDVRSLNFLSLVRPAPLSVQGPEITIRSCDAPAGAAIQSMDVDKDNLPGEYVFPTGLPANTVSWSITRVRLRLARQSSTGTYTLRITNATALKRPGTTVLASAPNPISGLPSSAAWVDIPIGPLTGLAPTQGVCITIYLTGGSNQLKAEYVQGAAAQMPPNAHFMVGNQGGNWSGPNDQQDLRFVLYGKVTTAVEQPPQ